MAFKLKLGKKHIFIGKYEAKCKFCGKRSRFNTRQMRNMPLTLAECPNGVSPGIWELLKGRINCYDE